MWAVREYCKLAKAVKLYSNQAKVHAATVEYKHRDAKAKFLGMRMRFFFGQYMAVRGKNLRERNHNVARDALSNMATSVYEVQRAKALSILKASFLPWLYLMLFKNKTARLIYLMKILANQLLDHKNVVE